jgi:hypothetical protein
MSRVFAIAILISIKTTQAICLITVQFSSLKIVGNAGISKKYNMAITVPVTRPNSREMINRLKPSNRCSPKGRKRKRKKVTNKVAPIVIREFFFTEYSKG